MVTEARVSQLESSLAGLQGTLQQLQADFATATQRDQGLRDALETQLTALRTEFQRIDGLHQDLGDRADDIENLLQGLNQGDIQAMGIRLTQTTTSVEQHEQDLQTVRQSTSGLDQRLT